MDQSKLTDAQIDALVTIYRRKGEDAEPRIEAKEKTPVKCQCGHRRLAHSRHASFWPCRYAHLCKCQGFIEKTPATEKEGES